MSDLIIIDPGVNEFSALLAQGIAAWEKAGKILVRLVEKDPAVFETILADNAHLTREILERFLQVGRRQIFPQLLVDGSPGAQRLMTLPYEVQQQLHGAEVPVVLFSNGATITKSKPIGKLTKSEAERAFTSTGLRPVAAQAALLRHKVAGAGNARGTSPHHAVEPEVAARTEDGLTADLSADPKAEVARLAKLAQDALVAIREALALVRRDHPVDRFVTVGLSAVGQIRFACNEKEI